MITFSEVEKEMRRLAKEYPNTHAACSYFDSSGTIPVCIVGHAFVNLDVGLSQVPNGDGYHDDYDLVRNDERVGHCSETVNDLQWKLLGIRKPTKKQQRWASEVQSSQDSGLSWGESVEQADREASERKLVAA